MNLDRQRAGIIRMKGMTPQERRNLALKGSQARWGEAPPKSRPTYRSRKDRALMERADRLERSFLNKEITYEAFMVGLDGMGCEIDYDRGELVRCSG